MAISPPQLSYAAFAADKRGSEFLQDYARAEAMVREGRARAGRDSLPAGVRRLGRRLSRQIRPARHYNVLNLIDRTACPLVVTYGTEELNTSAAFRGMPEKIAALSSGERRHVQLVAGADHFYAGMYGELWGAVESGLRRVELPDDRAISQRLTPL